MSSTRGAAAKAATLTRSAFWRALALTGAVAAAGCGPVGFSSGSKDNLFTSEPSVQTNALPAGDVLGSGPTRIAMILPLTQAGAPSSVGHSLRNAAELAISEAGAQTVTISIRDDQSTPEGARNAAQAAVAEGAQAIIGPLYASSVREVGRVARGAGRPVVAFSTDSTTAGPGVYLLSFLVEGYVERVVDFAASRGKKSIAVLAPETDYGTVALAQLQQAAAARGVRVQAIERYRPGGAVPAAQRIGAVASQIDALFIPEQADQMAAVSRALTTAGVDPKKIQILGTGLWNDARVLNLPFLQGAWFAAPENAGFNAFAAKYRAKFGSDPTRISTLSYDAVSLVAALAGMQGGQGLSEATLTNPSGFNGADGLFRFRSNGQNERGLSVLQIRSGTTSVVSPAPRSFAPSGT